MKKRFLFSLLLFCFVVNAKVYADEIWLENFSTYINKGYWGNVSDMQGVNSWILNVSQCVLEDEDDYVKVVATNGGRLEARDCDGEAIWTSKAIDISNFTNCSISLLAKETGSSTSANKYIRCYYRLDGGAEVPFDVNHENKGNWGSANVTTNELNGNQLHIIVKLNTPNSGDKVCIDDVLVLGNPVVAENNKFTILKSSQNPIPEKAIGSTANQREHAVACFNFVIDETNVANDGVPTKVSKMTFYNSHPTRGMNWKTQIGGILLFESGLALEITESVISEDSISLNFNKQQIDIHEGTQKEFELCIYLNPLSEHTDGEHFQLYIEENAKSFESFAEGSGFSKSNARIYSSIHSMDVKATQILLFQNLQHLTRNQDFTILAKAVDSFGNVDFDENSSLKIDLHKGKADLSFQNGCEKQFNQGTVIFDALKYPMPDTIQLKLESTNFPDFISPEIIVLNTHASQAVASNWFPVDNDISSLHVEKDSAFEIFRFSFKDAGNDEVGTILRKICLKASPENQLDFTKTMAGFYLMRGQNEAKVDFKVSKEQIDILFFDTCQTATIEDESTAEFSLFAYFQPGECIDDAILQLKIEQFATNWEVSPKGSGLKKPFDSEITGPQFRCEVKAEKMSFAKIPKTLQPNEKFTVEIELIDRYGNLDLNSDILVNLSIGAGSGTLYSESGLSKKTKNGKLEWTDLQYEKAEYFTIQAEAEGLKTILSDNISSVDQNSNLSGGKIITTHLSALGTTAKTANPVLNFTISDSASHDNLPSIVNVAKFYKRNAPNALNWKKHIAGAVIVGNGQIVASSTEIEDEYIRFYSGKGILEVDNGKQENFQLAVFFKESQLPDNANLELFIPKINADWKTGINSSELQINKEISSEKLKLEVFADRLKIIAAPSAIANHVNNFDLKVAACDQFQNIDTDVFENFSLEVFSHKDELIQSYNLSLNQGIVEIKSVNCDKQADFKINTLFNSLSDTCEIRVGKELLHINCNFETDDLHPFENTKDWSISTYEPLKGTKSLKHNLTNQSGKSYISRKLENWHPEKAFTMWNFIVKNGDWDPSSENFFVFHLCMDDADPEKSQTKYSVGVNLKGSKDLLSFWKTEAGKTPELLLESNLNWNENECIAIQMTYSVQGKWSLAYNRLGEEQNQYVCGEVVSEIHEMQNPYYCGLEFHYGTASRAGQLWLDHLQIQAINTAPFIKFHKIQGHDSILVAFSETLNPNQKTDFENCKIALNEQELRNYSVSIAESNKEVLVKFDTKMKTGNYLVALSGIEDENTAIMKPDSIHFEYFAPAKNGDLVINEIMADETPPNALPEYEYIEIYNNSTDPRSMNNWTLHVGKQKIQLDSQRIEAKSYLILCSKTAATSFAQYGKVLALSNFSGLNNTGNSLILKSSEGITIDSLTYSDSWYQFAEKSEGGWSLERIDPLNFSWQKNNWIVSNDSSGGTPGKINSVFAENKDNTPPFIEQLIVLNPNSIQLTFSEPMMKSEMLNPKNYSISPNNQQISKILPVSEFERVYEIQFLETLVANRKYTLTCSEKITDLANNYLENKAFEFWIPSQIQTGDIVINEILFNPLPGGVDYVELYNRTNHVFDLSQLYLGKKDENYKLTESIQLLSTQNLLHPKSYCVFTPDTLSTAESYFTSNSEVFYQAQIPNYPDKEGRIVLFTQHESIDDFEYSEKFHFELLSTVQGVALERVNHDVESKHPSNWQSATQNAGFGTPGLPNSVFREMATANEEVSLSSKILSPDNDGVNDRLYLHFNLSKDGYLANVSIFNSSGREVRKLATNLYLGKNDKIHWDGLNADHKRLPMGIYVIYIELFNPSGRLKSYKKTCVIGGKLK